MIMVPYKAEHMLTLQVQQAQCGTFPCTLEYAKSAEGPQTWTALEGDEVLGVGGVMAIWEGRGTVWSILGVGARAHFVELHRACRKILDDAPQKRLESDCLCSFPAGHRWLRMLGFRLEAACARSYYPDGSDASLYSRVK